MDNLKLKINLKKRKQAKKLKMLQKKKLKLLAKKKLLTIKKKKKKPAGRTVGDAVAEYKAHLAKIRPALAAPPAATADSADTTAAAISPEVSDRETDLSHQSTTTTLESHSVSVQEVSGQSSSIAPPTPPPGAFINPAISARRASNASQSSQSNNLDELQQIKDFIREAVTVGTATTAPSEVPPHKTGAGKESESGESRQMHARSVVVDTVKTVLLDKTAIVATATESTTTPEVKNGKNGKKSKKKGNGTKRSLRSNAPESPSKRKQQLEEEELEECEECKRRFRGYFSLMRHYAFTHQREKTAALLKLNPKPVPAVLAL